MRRVVLGLVALVFWGCGPQIQTHKPRALSTTLLLSHGSGAWVKGGKASLYPELPVQNHANHVVLEAEEALSFRWQEGVGALVSGRSLDSESVVQIYARDTWNYAPQKDPSGQSQGGYVDFASQAKYSFVCKHPGTYTLWARHYLPKVGGWVYRQRLNGEPVKAIVLSRQPAGRWFWTRCGTYTLTEGTHTLELTNFHGGKRLDRLVFAKTGTSFSPKGKWSNQDGQKEAFSKAKTGEKTLSVFNSALGPPASPKQPVTQGQVYSEPVTLVDAAGLNDLLLPAQLNGGKVTPWISVSNAKYIPVPQSGDLSAMGLQAGDSVRFRFDVEAKKTPPVVFTPSLNYTAQGLGLHTLQNKHLLLHVCKQTGVLAGLYNRATRQLVAPFGQRLNMFEVHLKEGPPPGPYDPMPLPKGQTLSFFDAQVLSVNIGANAIEAKYGLLENKLIIKTNITLDHSPLTRWSISIENHSDLQVQWVRFPKLERIKIGESSLDDVLAFPRVGGEMIPVPAQSGAWSYGYPGKASFSYMDLFDDHGGLYVAAYDKNLTACHLETAPRRDGEHVDLVLRKVHRIQKGETYTWHYAVGLHQGDWHWGADQYRDYFYKTFGKPKYPAWLKETDGWVSTLAMHQPPNRAGYDNFMRSRFDQALRYGCRYNQVWGTTGRGACPSYYLPLKELGGEDAFIKANQWWENLGGRVGYYLHGNATGGAYHAQGKYYLTPWEDYPEAFRPQSFSWWKKNRSYTSPDMEVDQRSQVRHYKRAMQNHMGGTFGRGMDNFLNMTMQSKSWPRFLRFWGIETYAKRYHADTIYWDTFAWGGERPEYNPYLGCFGEGNITPKRVAFLKENLEEAQAFNPGFTQLTEGCVDAYGVYAYHMISGFTRNPEIFRYTLPDQIVFEGQANGGYKDPEKSVRRMEKAVLHGTKFDVRRNLMHGVRERNIWNFRKWYAPWQHRARFLDTLGLTLSHAQVKGKVHTVDDKEARGLLCTIRNSAGLSGVRARVDLAPHVKPFAAFLFEPGQLPKKLPHTFIDGTARFVVPTATVSAVLFVEKARGPMAYSAVAWQKEDQGLFTGLLNFSYTPHQTEVVAGNQTHVFGGGLGVHHHVFAIDRIQALALAEKINLTFRQNGQAQSLFQGLYPALYDWSFEWRGEAFKNAPHGQKVLRADTFSLAHEAEFNRGLVEVSLTPGKTYTLSFDLLQEKAGTKAFLETSKVPSRFWKKFGGAHRHEMALPSTTGKWVTVKTTFTPKGRGWFYMENFPGRVYIDNFRVTEVTD